MGHFAKVENEIVTNIIVAEQDFIDTLEDKNLWIQTSYNTRGGIHLLNGTPLRKNYACIGFIYDKEKDAFIPPKPFNSWILNEDTCLWEAPIEKPEGNFIWNENELKWELINL
jgi:hypothetical protein